MLFEYAYIELMLNPKQIIGIMRQFTRHFFFNGQISGKLFLVVRVMCFIFFKYPVIHAYQYVEKAIQKCECIDIFKDFKYGLYAVAINYWTPGLLDSEITPLSSCTITLKKDINSYKIIKFVWKIQHSLHDITLHHLVYVNALYTK